VTPSPLEIATQLSSIVGEANVRQQQDLTPDLQWKLAQTLAPIASAACMVYPQTQTELAAVVACAHAHRWRMLPCGRGSKLDWGGLPQGIDILISTERLDRLVEHAAGDMTVTVEAGIGFANLQRQLAAAGQFVALDPAFGDRATLGGILATRDAGSLRHRYGGVRDMCLGLSFIRHDGQRVKAGGRVVKNVAGYDLMKLLAGSFGSLGIVSEITLRLYPLPEASQTHVLSGPATAIAAVVSALLNLPLTPTAVDLISPRLVPATLVGGEMGLVVRFQGLPESVSQQGDRLQILANPAQLKTITLSGMEEMQYWQTLATGIGRGKTTHPSAAILCQLGALSTQSVPTLEAIAQLCQQYSLAWTGLIHAGSGLGNLLLEGDLDNVSRILPQVRSRCQSAAGFLTILQAPCLLKTQLDAWGYSGNALASMRTIKQQFDPHSLLSPHRFVGGI
jgi:glycolate oxidase FAD binding subunit